ncbi:MAG: M60 family metallopeptidase [Alloprevotella sp.]
MKNSLFWRITLLLSLFSAALVSKAQLSVLEQGKVYRFTNVGQSSYALAATTLAGANGETVTSGSDDSDYPQLWYVSEVKDNGGVNTYRLRNMGNGLYLQGKGQSTRWQLVEESTADNTYLYLQTVGTTHNTLSVDNTTGGYKLMHLDGSRNVVGWSSDNASTQWDITEVSIDAATIEANWAALAMVMYTDTQISGFQTALDAIFTDKACTTLQSGYASMTETALTGDTYYQALPSTLQAMVLKIWKEQTGTATLKEAWTESNYDTSKPEWDGDYAKRFRIQNYEVYTERDCTNSGLGINIHTNLNNPTGIFGNYRQVLFVMVDQEVPANASLYLGSYVGHGQGGNYNDGVELHQGLNVIPYWGDKTWTCIYYTAKTLKSWDGTTNKADFDLTQFPDLKIHIEGGNINGFYNAVGDDLWAHDAATTGCDDGRNLSTVETHLTKADGTLTAENDNLLQSNCIYPKGDNEADWDYYAERNVMEDLTILGRYMIFQFCYESPESGHADYCTSYWFNKQSDDTRRVNIAQWLERWDRIMMSERLVMGLLSEQEIAEANARYHAWDETKHDIFTYTGNDGTGNFGCDYSKHYRMHGLAITLSTGYMSGGWTSSNYNYSTLPDIIGQMTDESSSGGVTWGPGHEIGHQHQSLLNMRGLTEVSNNMFSNVAVWYDGRGTSRTNSGEGDLTNVLKAYNTEGHDFFTNNIWAQTQMYYKLWLYYHLVGHNTKFVPRLFEMLRRDPMVIQYDQQGTTSLLHFYKKVCDAAGEDLTEFFRAYGFFEVMDKRFVGDYSNAEYTQTQDDIDAAIASVKAKGYRENCEILFINDCTAGDTYVKHDGTTARRLWDGTTYSDLGGYLAYQDETKSPVSGTYELTVTDGTAQLSGATGGVGFFIYDADGNLMAFSSDYSFPVSDATVSAIAKGTAVVTVVTDDGTQAEVPYEGSSAAESLIKGALDKAAQVLAVVDEGGTNGYTKVGFYKNTAVEKLQTLYGQALSIYKDAETGSYVSAYQALNEEYQNVMANEYARVAFVPGSTCVLVNKNDKTRYLSEVEVTTTTTVDDVTTETTTQKVATTVVSGGVVVANVPEAGQWVFETGSAADTYYLKNKSFGDYAANLVQSVALLVGSTAYGYTLLDNEDGSWGIKYSDNNQLIHKDGGNNIVGWGDTGNVNSHWYITMVSKDEVQVAQTNLRELAEKTQALIDQMANVSVKGVQDMSKYRISSNSVEQGHSTDLLTDGDLTTYYHSEWTGTSLNEDHYLQIDCGEGASLEQFTFNYVTLPTSAGNTDAPTAITVAGSNTVDSEGNVSDFTTLASLTKDADGLPGDVRGASYTSPALATEGTGYRFIRLTVTNATHTSTINGHHWFGLAELGLTRTESTVNSKDAKYTTLTDAALIAAADAMVDANTLLANEEATQTDLDNQYSTLNTAYETLLAAYNEGENAELNAAKAVLQTVIDNTQTLLGECGTVTFTPANFPLQSTDENAAGFLYCNKPYTGNNSDYSEAGTDGYHLLDGDLTTYLHTDYSGTASTEDHYLRVYCGEEGMEQFAFTYTTRNDGDGQPTSMVVEGSNEADGTYTALATLTSTENGLPTGHSAVYNSEVMGADGVTYKYIRFRVTGNSKNQQTGGHYWFCMAEFGMARVTKYEVSLGDNCGMATESDLIDTYDAIRAAKASYNMATSVEQLQQAQADLQAQYEVLNTLKNAPDRTDINAAIASLQSLYAYCFNDEECTTLKTAYQNSLNLTDEVLNAAQAALETAQTVNANGFATAEELAAQVTMLEAQKAALQEAIGYAALPVKLTTDTENPTYYKIVINRDGYPVFQSRTAADGEENKIKLAAFEAGNDRQGWYFVKGTEAPKVRIVNKATPDLVVACIPTDFAEGAGKIISQAVTVECGTNEWVISNTNSLSGWYNITADKVTISDETTTTTTFYMSNNSGVNYNMGFYNAANDPGSNFRFEEVDIWDRSEAFYTLYNYYHGTAKFDLSTTENAFPADLQDASAIGYYQTSLATAYTSAFNNATAQLEGWGTEDVTDETLTAAYEKLVAANEALVVTQPATDKFYVLRSACTSATYCTSALAYADVTSHTAKWSKDKVNTDATAVWYFEQEAGNYYLRNLHTGTYLTNDATGTYQPRALSETTKHPVTFSPLGSSQLNVRLNGNLVHAQELDNALVNWSGGLNSASAWRIEEVDVADVAHTLSMSAYGYAGFYSAYPVTLPEGLQAYYIQQTGLTEPQGETAGSAKLTEITGVIPAHTGVVLCGAEGSYSLSYSASEGTAVADNLLKGSPYLRYLAGDAGWSYYLFGVMDSEVGLYKAYLEYNADGSQSYTQETDGTDEDGNPITETISIDDTDNGGYFRVSANKIYMAYSPTATEAAVAFHFDFGQVETASGGLVATPSQCTVIYDLQGRRLGSISQPGIYIVNGVKRYVKAVPRNR